VSLEILKRATLVWLGFFVLAFVNGVLPLAILKWRGPALP
jgi:hypothetical protein